jgi:hypothetical protein
MIPSRHSEQVIGYSGLTVGFGKLVVDEVVVSVLGRVVSGPDQM